MREIDPELRRKIDESADRLMNTLSRAPLDDVIPIERGTYVPDNERPCGCRTEAGVFMPCADHQEH